MITYPSTLILVSNTETTMSLSKDTSRKTSWTACSNSSKSPRITNVSRVSIKVREKLKKKHILDRLILSNTYFAVLSTLLTNVYYKYTLNT